MIKITEAIRIYKNSAMFLNTLMIDVSDKEVLREEKHDKYVNLYHGEELVGINVFDESLASLFEEGFTYPTKEALVILNKYFNEDLFNYDKGLYLRVGEIVALESVKNSDKLHLCTVKINEETYSIICGAANVYEGMKTIVALDNALLPTGVRINEGPVFGVHSDGMLCSKRELGLFQDESEVGIVDLDKDEEMGLSFFDIDWRKYNV